MYISKVDIDVNARESVEDLARSARRQVWQKLLPTGAAHCHGADSWYSVSSAGEA